MSAWINPSILAADFVNIERDLARISDADGVHVDVMDYHFVPNLTFGLEMVDRVNEVTPLPLDVHLMIDNPTRFAADYARVGVASITFHAEATDDIVALARDIRRHGARAGVALSPETPAEIILDSIDEFDLILVMTVHPGFGGQDFMPSTMPKLAAISRAIEASGSDIRLQVDGGITEKTIGIASAAGADTFVAGSSIFGSDNPGEQIRRLRRAAHAAPFTG